MEPSTKRPILVILISIVIIATSSLLALHILDVLRGESRIILLGYGNVIFGALIILAKIIFSIGLLKMRKWALLGITVTFIADIILSILTAGHLVEPIILGIKILTLGYLWLIRKKFS